MKKADALKLRQKLLQVAVSEQAQMGEVDRYGAAFSGGHPIRVAVHEECLLFTAQPFMRQSP